MDVFMKILDKLSTRIQNNDYVATQQMLDEAEEETEKIILVSHKEIIGNRYELKRNKSELKEIEKDLAEYLGVPFVRCGYDDVNSHKYKDKHEVEYRKKEAKETGLWSMCDYVINYEKYETLEDYNTHDGGYDGEVYELLYLKGNGNYIVITGCSE